MPDPAEKIPIWKRAAVSAFGATLAGLGAVLTAGGAWLVALGGSPYYALAGSGLIISGLLTFKRRLSGLLLYLAIFGATILWAVAEAGLHFWPLFARLFAPLVLAVIALFLAPLVTEPSSSRQKRLALLAGTVLLCVTGAVGFAATRPHGVKLNNASYTPGRLHPETAAAGGEWHAYGRTNRGTRYAPFDQINAANVHKLEVAWTTRHGDISELGNEDQNTPLYVDGLLYHCSPSNIVTAIDGSTGRIVWRFDPKAMSPFWHRCRTLAYSPGAPGDGCGPRIFLATIDGRLMAIGARDGKACPTFGPVGPSTCAKAWERSYPASTWQQPGRCSQTARS